MLLRSLVDNHLPIGPDEIALSPEAQSILFRGQYPKGTELTTIHAMPTSSSGNTYKVALVRETPIDYSGMPNIAVSPVLTADGNEVAVIKELQELVINRVNSVERTARIIKRRTKLAAYVLAAVGLLGYTAQNNGWKDIPSAEYDTVFQSPLEK